MPPPAASTPQNARATPSPFSFADRTAPAPLRNGKGPQPARAYDQSSSSLSIEQVEGLRRQSHLSTLSLSPRRPSLAPSGSTTTARPRRGTSLAVAAGADVDDSGFLGQSVDDAAPWTMVDRMRNWRNDAMTQHLYDSAKFWGGKVLGITGAHPPLRTRSHRRTLTLLSSSRQCRRRLLARADPLPQAPVRTG